MRKKKVKLSRPLSVKKFCTVCCGDSAQTVTTCLDFDCHLWEWRCGVHRSSNIYIARLKRAYKTHRKEFDEMLEEYGITFEDFLTGRGAIN